MPGLQGDRLTRYWLEKKNIWLGEGETAQITSDQQVRIQKKALTGSHKACFVRR